MVEKPFHVTGIGNAIVDVMAYVSYEFLARHQLAKGRMTLVSDREARRLYEAMGTCAECSGGSVANTLAALASFGGKGAFIGKVADDAMGDIFRHDMRSTGVHFATQAIPDHSGATAHCLIAVTPDAERTMSTHLGVAALIREADIDAALIAASRVLYIEGYLWDAPDTIAALRLAIGIAKQAGTLVAFSLSDVFCVERHRASFHALIADDLDILFANEAEIMALYETGDWNAVVERIQGKCRIACLTRSGEGSLMVTPQERIHVMAEPVREVVDTTGAGDLYAAGVLYGVTHDYPLHEAGKLGSRAAAQIIQHLGARSMRPLEELVAG